MFKAGGDVTFIARGPHLAAMRERGVILKSGAETFTVHPRCTSDAAEAGPQDYVIVTLKAHSLPSAAPQIARLMGAETALVMGINGVPYWYFHGIDSPHRDRTIEAVDPGGIVWRTLPPERVIGAVVYPAAEVIAPGVIEHTYGDRISLGEPDGGKSPRVEALAKLMIAAGIKAPVRPRLRDEIWVKLWGNLAFNPLSALTTATLDRLTAPGALRDVARSMMVEAKEVAEALGVRFAIDIEQRIDGAAEVGAHKTSMLQDLERGRPMEIDALLGAVVELGILVGQPDADLYPHPGAGARARTPGRMLPAAMIKLLGRYGLDGFLLALFAVVGLAWLVPDLGRSGGFLHIDFYTNYGISMVFLLYGLTLSWDRVRAGALNWRLHLVVLGATFIVYPALVWGIGAAAGSMIGSDVKLGFFYLSASPSTISSSVAMTSIARGNVAGAIFNASLSSLVGVFVTPLWVNWYLSQTGEALALGHVILKILLLVFAPIVLGQAVRPLLADWIARQKLLVKVIDRGTILAIVFNSLADSVADGVWKGRGAALVLLVAIGAMLLFASMFLLLEAICKALGFNRADTIAGVFCGTKKSLASGISMAKVMFGSSPSLGMIILPFVIYHLLQLIAASVIARRWAAVADR